MKNAEQERGLLDTHFSFMYICGTIFIIVSIVIFSAWFGKNLERAGMEKWK